jgi:hypothetical protein
MDYWCGGGASQDGLERPIFGHITGYATGVCDANEEIYVVIESNAASCRS